MMISFSSVAETAERWNITQRRVQVLCNENRIDGAIKQSGIWLIPSNARKPQRLLPGKRTSQLLKCIMFYLYFQDVVEWILDLRAIFLS